MMNKFIIQKTAKQPVKMSKKQPSPFARRHALCKKCPKNLAQTKITQKPEFLASRSQKSDLV